MKLILKDKKVCVSIEKLESDMNRYNFLSIMGSLEEVTDNNEKKNAMEIRTINQILDYIELLAQTRS